MTDPDGIGSGGPPPQPKNLPKFPNNTELVFGDGHSELLSALLPAMNKYQCLRVGTKKRCRSPWVRAFCDLYHPTGPFGSNKFSNAPDITSNRKYSFKSYQIPTLFKQLKRYGGDSEVHLALKAALVDYFGKEEWRKKFLHGCELVAAIEVNKPFTERAAIPTVETGVVVVVDVDVDVVATAGAATTTDEDKKNVVAAATAAAATTTDEDQKTNTPTSPRRRKRKTDPLSRNVRPRTRSQRRQQVEEELRKVKDDDDVAVVEEQEQKQQKHTAKSPSAQTPESIKKQKRSETHHHVARERQAQKHPPTSDGWPMGSSDRQPISPESAEERPAQKDLPISDGWSMGSPDRQPISPESTEERPAQKDPPTPNGWQTGSPDRQTGSLESAEERPAQKELSTPDARQTISPDRQTVSPKSAKSDKRQKKENLDQKRTELAKLLSLRRGANGASTKDTLCDKIQKQIDIVDEEVLELILG